MLAASFVACGHSPPGPEDNPPVLVDTTGIEFEWACDGSGCKLGNFGIAPACDPQESAIFGLAWGRFYEICSVCDGESRPDGCRPVSCKTDSDCPQIFWYTEMAEYECRHGLCQNLDTDKFPTSSLDIYDLFTLCFADIDRMNTFPIPNATSDQVYDWVLGACPDPAKDCAGVPIQCWQP